MTRRLVMAEGRFETACEALRTVVPDADVALVLNEVELAAQALATEAEYAGWMAACAWCGVDEVAARVEWEIRRDVAAAAGERVVGR